MIAGLTNACKSTVLGPVIKVFGPAAVACTPALGASTPLSSLASASKRFLYWDEFSPTEYASRPPKSPTVPATTFEKLLAGQLMETQASQSFNDGNPWVAWKHGAALTAPLEGLWNVEGPVSKEDVKHMQSRVMQFDALVPVQGPLRDIPHCPESWCRWVVDASAAFSTRQAPVFPDVSLPVVDDEDL